MEAWQRMMEDFADLHLACLCTGLEANSDPVTDLPTGDFKSPELLSCANLPKQQRGHTQPRRAFYRCLPLACGLLVSGMMQIAPAAGLTTHAVPSLFISQAIAAEDSLTLRLEDTGDLVAELQRRLSDLGYYNGPISSVFGEATQTAVVQFQADSGLFSDGVVGAETATALRQASRQQNTQRVAAAGIGTTLQSGDRGDAVTNLQQRLQSLGYYNGPISGTFGNLTVDAVIRFQADNGLTADGVVGASTQAALDQALTSQRAVATPVAAVGFATASSNLLQLGDSGTAVVTLQRRLQELGFYRGALTGNFDLATEAAVIQFQRSQGIGADGIVGPVTNAALANPVGIVGTPLPPTTPAPLPPVVVTPPQPSVPPTPADAGFPTGRFSVLALQRRLQERGFDPGPIDGVLGPQTRAAIAAAQRAYGLNERDVLRGQFP